MSLPSLPRVPTDRLRDLLRPMTRAGSLGGLVPAARLQGEPERLFDQEFLARLQRLVLASRRTIAEGLAGEHRSRRRGASPEFADFKSYSQGDDFRRIDWNTYARLDDLFVRLSEVTTEFNVHLLLDASNSMDWRGSSRVPTKFTYARRATGALGYVSLWHFDRVTVAPFGTTLAQRFGPSQGRSYIVPLLRYLEQLQPLGGTDLAAILGQYPRMHRRPGVLLIVSDLLSGEPAALSGALRDLRANGWLTTILHILDEAELTPALLAGAGDSPEATELVEVETGERLRLTPTAAVLDRYRDAFATWLTDLESLCASEEIDYLRLQTDWELETLVLRLLHQRGVLA